jgi:hypothetical protein
MKRYNALMRAYSRHPPVNWLVAGYLGYKSPELRQKEALENTRRMYESLKGGGKLKI